MSDIDKKNILKTKNIEFLKEKKLKIDLEKHYRHHFESIYNYSNSFKKPKKFFSKDCLKTINDAILLQNDLQLENLTIECVFFSFICKNKNILSLLKSYNITKEILFSAFFSKNLKNYEHLFDNSKFLNFKNFISKYILKNKNKNDFQNLDSVFEDIIKFTYKRFKTIIITPEIFIVSCLEKNKISKIKNLFLNESEYKMFLFDLYKIISHEETLFNINVSTKEYLFGFLLKKYLNKESLLFLFEKKKLRNVLENFRDIFVSNILKINLLTTLKKNIYQTNFLFAKERKYSI